jgi:hypothetical protein
MNLRSSWVAETGQTREDTRLTQIGATTPVNTLEAHSGVLPGSYTGEHRLSGFWLQGGVTMNATLHGGRAVIQGSTGQGVYPVTLPSPQTITFGDGDAQPRVDLVVLRVYDRLYHGGTRNEAVAEIVRGTPGEPNAPATPPLALPLYRVQVPAGASAGAGGINWATAVTDMRTPVVAIGGILPVQGAVRDGAYPGQYQDAGDTLQRWQDFGWVAYPRAIGGIVPSGVTINGSYPGQYRDSPAGVLQRWNGTAWVNQQPAVETETVTTGTTGQPGWTVNWFQARRTRGICTLTAVFTRSGADITANSAGNINDEDVFVLPAGWRPPMDIEAAGCDGFGSGGLLISPNGLVRLRTWSANGLLTAGRNVRVSATFVL